MRSLRKLSGQEWDAINAAEAQAKAEKRLGHLYKLTVQHRYGESKAIPSDLKVWVSCTCGWAHRDSFTDKALAFGAFADHVEGKTA